MALGELDRDVFERWRSFASERAGRFDENSKAIFHRPTPGMEIDVGTARLYLDIDQKGGNSTIKVTRVRAHLAVPRGPRFKVRPQGLASAFGKRLGTQDIELGGPPSFDRIFVIKTREPGVTGRMWTDRIKALMLDLEPPPRITSDGSLIMFKVDAVLTKHETLDEVLEIVGTLAMSDIFGLSAIEALPKVEYHPPSGPWDERTLPTATVPSVVPVEIGPVIEKKTVHTRVTAVGISDELHHSARIDEGRLDRDETRLPEIARSPARRVGSASLTVGDGRAVVDWSGVEDDVDRLQAGVELVTAFAIAPNQGTFR